MASPRTPRSTDDPAGDPAQVQDSAAVARVDEPAVADPAPDPAPDAPTADAVADPATVEDAPAPDDELESDEQPVVDAPAPVGRPPLSEVAEASARGAFPDPDPVTDDAQEG